MKIVWWWGIMVCLLSGCATLQREREMRYMPEATNPSGVRAAFASACETARASAITSGSKEDVLRMVDSCSAVSAISCTSWMRRDVLLAQGIVMRDSTLNAVDAATTIAAGAFNFSPGAVAALGGLQLVGHLVGQVEKSGLGVPDTYLAQAKMRSALSDCSTKLIGQATAGMSLAAATIGLDSCEWVCTPGAATTITTQALAQAEVVVQPSGALSVTTVSSSFQKDDSSQRIISFWMPDGRVSAANDAKIKKWMSDNSISVSVPFLAHAKVYESARKQAVTDLGIP